MNIINTKQETYITLAPSLTGLISHYKYGTLYNIYTITNNYNHTSHKYIIYYTCIFVNMYNMKNVRISSDILDMAPCICRPTYMILYLHALVSRRCAACRDMQLYHTHPHTHIAMSNNQSIGVGYSLFNLNQL